MHGYLNSSGAGQDLTTLPKHTSSSLKKANISRNVAASSVDANGHSKPKLDKI